MIPRLFSKSSRLALPLGVLGITWAALRNHRMWKQDRAILAEAATPVPVPPLDAWQDLPLVSVLVAAWNEEAFIELHIRSFLDLRYPNKELVICAGGEDQTWEAARRYDGQGVKVLRQRPGEGKQRALARSLPAVQGAIILLTDADCRLEDEPFERTVWPIACGAELVVSGASKPLEEQLVHPFAFTQASTQLYSSWHTAQYAAGILGRNCAIDRQLLERSGALNVPAPSGTDYVLAKSLNAKSVPIRQEPRSLMPTQYPTTAVAYMQQQRRWLRNVALHGRRFDAQDEMRASLRTSLLGLTMLLLPIASLLLTPWLLVLWSAFVAHALFARLRYIQFAGPLLGRKVRLEDLIWQPPILLLDFFTWSRPLLDYVRRGQRWDW